MASLWHSLLDLVFPPGSQCPLCQAPSPGGAVCGPCLGTMESYRRLPCCRRCGRLPGKGALTAGRSAALLCRECAGRDWPFELARAAGPYEGVLKEAIHRFKYAGRRGLAGCLAGFMAAVAREEPLFKTAGLIVPVPLSGAKLRRRGFNQSLLLAREVGALLRLPVEERSLRKLSETPPQAGLPRAARKSNLENAFKAEGGSVFTGKSILLLDDVFTTGSTLEAAASALRQAGAGRVFGLTAATGRFS